MRLQHGPPIPWHRRGVRSRSGPAAHPACRTAFVVVVCPAALAVPSRSAPGVPLLRHLDRHGLVLLGRQLGGDDARLLVGEL
eukprot:5162566-Alexandrium_andersonii.AAC.1